MAKVAFAVAAHPDDIEFQMAGTLALLGEAGYTLHYMTIANGSCGSVSLGAEEIAAIRREESIAAAGCLKAAYHESLVPDIDIFYEKELLARVSAVMREVAPDILLVQSPEDYMEDHQNACRLAVSAAFCRGMPNFPTDPPAETVETPVTIYHAQPHGNVDPLRRRVEPDLFVDVTDVLDRKREMLACHRSQKEWLDHTQGMDSYLKTMVDLSGRVGAMSERYEYAEGWRRHLHYGFCDEAALPLETALAAHVTVVRD